MNVRVIVSTAIAMLGLVSAGRAEQAWTTITMDKNRMIEWGANPTPTKYQHGAFTFATAFVGDGAEAARNIIELHVVRDGLPFSQAVFQASYGAGGIGLFEMGLPEPVLVVATYSGGAHCCTLFNLLPLMGEEPDWFATVGFEGDVFDLDDVDGDGVYEIARPDPRFPHAEGAMAGTWSPPLIVGFRDGQLQDITSAPRYRSYLLDAEKAISTDCGDGGWFSQGCVAWGAIAHHLGTLDEVLGEIAERVEAAPADTGMARPGFDLIENEISEAIRILTLCAPIKQGVVTDPLSSECQSKDRLPVNIFIVLM